MRSGLKGFIYSLFFAIALMVVPAASFADIGVSITIAPPELPVYDQPACPGDGYIWVPGYWAWGDSDYYWVPGTWVMAPEPGLLWTPGYWGWNGASFVFYNGYWGPQVGFYGGIDYGFGYFGHGYDGGRWDNGHFFYNRAVNNVNVTVVHNVYKTTVVNNTRNVTRVSFNGGNGGVNERPSAQEEAASRERHVAPVAAQVEQVQSARADTQLRASANHGKPPIAATERPGAFNDGAVAKAKQGSYNSAPRNGNNARPAEVRPNEPAPAGNMNPSNAMNNTARPVAKHPNELPPSERMAAPNSGNPKLDKKYQQQQDKLNKQQDQQRQKLQQRQDQEHQQLTQRNADEARKQQVEQKHQQQTQQMVQKQAQQQQRLQQRQQPAAHAAPPPKPNAEERSPR